MHSELRRFRLRGESEGRQIDFLLPPGRHSVGSAFDQALVLKAPGVSRHHAVLWVDEGVRVEDLGSKNGTFVAGRRIERATAVEVGAKVEFGSTGLRLEQVEVDDVELGLDLSDGATTEEDRFPTHPARQSGPFTQTAAAGRTLSLEARDPKTGLLVEALDRLWSIPETDAALVDYARELFSAQAAALVENGADPATRSQVLAAAGDVTHWPEIDEAGDGNALGFAYLGFETEGDGMAGICGRLSLADRRLDLLLWQPQAHDSVLAPLLHLFLLWSSRGPAEGELDAVRDTGSLRFPPGHIPGESSAMRELYGQLAKVAAGDVPVLLLGETGVGKEHIAKLLHLSSPRHRGPMVAVNCAAIPGDLLEAELFGIAGGVATGVRARRGKLEVADGGTLLLDEIGDMPAELQAKLLRVLQEKRLEPLGGVPIDLDVRVVSATHADLRQRVEEGSFRRDLYYRLAGFEAKIPPLRQRRADIPRLIEVFARRFCEETGKRIRGLTVKALRALIDHSWPGNVRELEHEIRRLIYLGQEGKAVDWGLLSDALRDQGAGGTGPSTADGQALIPRLEALERGLIEQALEATEGNQTRAAQRLEISRNGLIQRMKRLGISSTTGR